jgi:hypothetical protein
MRRIVGATLFGLAVYIWGFMAGASTQQMILENISAEMEKTCVQGHVYTF